VVKWQTRAFEGRMPQGMGVRVPPRADFSPSRFNLNHLWCRLMLAPQRFFLLSKYPVPAFLFCIFEKPCLAKKRKFMRSPRAQILGS